jgi:hypothetical protein
VRGHRGRTVEALPIDATVQVLRRHGVPAAAPPVTPGRLDTPRLPP